MKVMKERVDVLLVEQGLADTREKAKRMVMAGLVYANEERYEKPGKKCRSISNSRSKEKSCLTFQEAVLNLRRH